MDLWGIILGWRYNLGHLTYHTKILGGCMMWCGGNALQLESAERYCRFRDPPESFSPLKLGRESGAVPKPLALSLCSRWAISCPKHPAAPTPSTEWKAAIVSTNRKWVCKTDDLGLTSHLITEKATLIHTLFLAQLATSFSVSLDVLIYFIYCSTVN